MYCSICGKWADEWSFGGKLFFCNTMFIATRFNENASYIIIITVLQPCRFGSVVALPDLDGEVSDSSPGPTNDFKDGDPERYYF